MTLSEEELASRPERGIEKADIELPPVSVEFPRAFFRMGVGRNFRYQRRFPLTKTALTYLFQLAAIRKMR
jgi:hypothetical protein